MRLIVGTRVKSDNLHEAGCKRIAWEMQVEEGEIWPQRTQSTQKKIYTTKDTKITKSKITSFLNLRVLRALRGERLVQYH
jgi:hypothetical protein